jgi:ribonuclease-3
MRGIFDAIRARRRPTEAAERDLVDRFFRATGVRFRNVRMLRQALTHRSHLGEAAESHTKTNERMEFLGDSVLELVVNDFLYHGYPESREGDLTKMRSLLVSRAILARRAREIGLGAFLLLSDAEDDSGGRDRESILADGYEAVIGAIYLDRSLAEVRAFIHRTLLASAASILADETHLNFKSLLQEHVQAASRNQPRYRVRSESGPDHEKVFLVDVLVKGEVLGTGSGKNKKEAEQEAARRALHRLDRLPRSADLGPSQASARPEEPDGS